MPPQTKADLNLMATATAAVAHKKHKMPPVPPKQKSNPLDVIRVFLRNLGPTWLKAVNKGIN